MSQSGPPADAKQAQAAALAELEDAQRRKRGIDTNLAKLEASIWKFEGSYLDETAASGGNIVKGFENYLKPPGTQIKKRADNPEADRLFSTSSVTFQQSLERQAAEAMAAAAMPPPPLPSSAYASGSYAYRSRSSSRRSPSRSTAYAAPPAALSTAITTPSVPSLHPPHPYASATAGTSYGITLQPVAMPPSTAPSLPVVTSTRTSTDTDIDVPMATDPPGVAGSSTSTQDLPLPPPNPLTPAELAALSTIDLSQLTKVDLAAMSNAELTELATKIGPWLIATGAEAEIKAAATTAIATSSSTGGVGEAGPSAPSTVPLPAAPVGDVEMASEEPLSAAVVTAGAAVAVSSGESVTVSMTVNTPPATTATAPVTVSPPLPPVAHPPLVAAPSTPTTDVLPPAFTDMPMTPTPVSTALRPMSTATSMPNPDPNPAPATPISALLTVGAALAASATPPMSPASAAVAAFINYSPDVLRVSESEPKM